MLVIPSLRYCSNKYKLAREGINKEKDSFFFFFLHLGWSQVVLKEMSFQLLLEGWRGSSIPDRGRKVIPPARSGERECSGKWFWASLWWYHKASLTSGSQTYGGDVDCHQWVEVGRCWACGCSICKHPRAAWSSFVMDGYFFFRIQKQGHHSLHLYRLEQTGQCGI